jgi:hypothetical protein
MILYVLILKNSYLLDLNSQERNPQETRTTRGVWKDHAAPLLPLQYWVALVPLRHALVEVDGA